MVLEGREGMVDGWMERGEVKWGRVRDLMQFGLFAVLAGESKPSTQVLSTKRVDEA
jgi:hypothetical protein